MNVTIVDYNSGNISSVINSFKEVAKEKVNIEEIQNLFEDTYKVRYNQGLELVTVRHYDQETLDRVTTDKDIILQQKTRETARLIVKQK